LDRPKYWAFLSYSHRDAKWGSWLHKALESYRPPRQLIGKTTARGPVPKRLAPVFRDREELASATDLGTVINEALTQSACQIVICSPNSARSKWVNEEILAFKRLGREDRIFCLIVDGEPNASDNPAIAEQECFPQALRYRLGPDGSLSTIRTEPIAADARAGKDGRGNAKLKLIAGVLGVGFDALRQREQQRRQRRLFAIASGATAGMVLTTGLAAAALVARATAQRQTVIAKREAETARQTTDFLVDLFKISDPSEARGNSLTAREVLDKGAARVEARLTKQPEIQATLMDTLGTVYMRLGLYAQAKPLLETATSKRRALGPAETPALAVSLSHVGDLLTQRAEYPGAETAYREAIALQKALPSDQRDDAALARSLFGLGDELGAQGHSADAERSLRDALALQKQLFPGANDDTARTLDELAWTIGERDLNESVPMLQSAVAMQRALWGNQPYPDYANALNDLGILLRSKSEYTESERLLRESLAMQRRLLGDKHPNIAIGLNNLAAVLHLKGDLEGANSTYRQALAMHRELQGELHPDVAFTLSNLALVMQDSGDLGGALEATRESLDIYRKLFPGDNPDVARTLNRLGYLLTESGDYSAADAYLQDGLKMRRRLFGEAHPEIASSLLHVAIFQIATRNYQDALVSARAAREMYTSALSASNWKTALAQSVNGAALAGVGKHAEAERELLQAYTLLSQNAAALPDYRNLTRRYLAELYRQWGRPAEAARYAVRPVRAASNSLAAAEPHAAASSAR
jgi:tetratricopeptide (TPR) repeat protein